MKIKIQLRKIEQGIPKAFVQLFFVAIIVIVLNFDRIAANLKGLAKFGHLLLFLREPAAAIRSNVEFK